MKWSSGYVIKVSFPSASNVIYSDSIGMGDSGDHLFEVKPNNQKQLFQGTTATLIVEFSATTDITGVDFEFTIDCNKNACDAYDHCFAASN